MPEPGNNENALAIQALQAKTLDVKKWIYQRGEDPSSQSQSGTMDDYYSVLVGTLECLQQRFIQKQELALDHGYTVKQYARFDLGSKS